MGAVHLAQVWDSSHLILGDGLVYAITFGCEVTLAPLICIIFVQGTALELVLFVRDRLR